MGSPPTPTVKSFLTADNVFRQDTGKWCLIGIFTMISARQFPVLHPSLGLYLAVSDAQGDYDVRVEFQDETGRCISSLDGIRFKTDNRLVPVQLGLQGYALPIPAPGTYFLKVFFNDQLADVDIRVPVEARR